MALEGIVRIKSQDAVNKSQHEDTGEGTSRPSGVPSKKQKVQGIQDEHRKFQET